MDAAFEGLRNRFWARQQPPPPPAQPQPAENTEVPPDEEWICRICLSGKDPELGPLISPCLCRGTQSKVHSLWFVVFVILIRLKGADALNLRWMPACSLNTWRERSRGQSSFWQCDQCHCRYRFGHRTRIAGLAGNPKAVYLLTALSFLFLVFISGFLASSILWLTNFLPSAPLFEDSLYWFIGSNPYASPLDYGEVLGGSIEQSMKVFSGRTVLQRLLASSGLAASPDSWTVRAVTHFSLGFSLIGILSFLQLAMSYSLLAPLHHWRVFRRQQQQRRAGERSQGMDTAAILAFLFVVIGVAKAVIALYKQVQRWTKWWLTRLEVTVLEAR